MPLRPLNEPDDYIPIAIIFGIVVCLIGYLAHLAIKIVT